MDKPGYSERYRLALTTVRRFTVQQSENTTVFGTCCVICYKSTDVLRDEAEVKSPGCSCRRSKFNPQHPHGGS